MDRAGGTPAGRPRASAGPVGSPRRRRRPPAEALAGRATACRPCRLRHARLRDWWTRSAAETAGPTPIRLRGRPRAPTGTTRAGGARPGRTRPPRPADVALARRTRLHPGNDGAVRCREPAVGGRCRAVQVKLAQLGSPNANSCPLFNRVKHALRKARRSDLAAMVRLARGLRREDRHVSYLVVAEGDWVLHCDRAAVVLT